MEHHIVNLLALAYELATEEVMSGRLPRSISIVISEALVVARSCAQQMEMAEPIEPIDYPENPYDCEVAF